MTKDINGNKVESVLFDNAQDKLSDRDIDLLMEQYKLYIELMDKVSERRHNANSFFLTVNTVLITALTGFISFTRQLSTQTGWVLVAAAAGITFCLTWKRLIRSYSQLNRGKFQIIHLLETRLPARLFDAEWVALGEGKDKEKYRTFTSMEIWVPLVFAGLYGLLILFVIWDLWSLLS